MRTSGKACTAWTTCTEPRAMPKKTPGVRWRYIAFRIEARERFTRNEFLGALLSVSRKGRLGDSFRITVFERDLGILKVPHTLKDDGVAALSAVESIEGVPCKVKTLKTSGTIKTLKEKYLCDRLESRTRWE